MKRNRILIRALVTSLMSVMLISCAFRKTDYTENILAAMTVEDKIGQMLMFGFPGTEMTESSAELIKKYRPGGIILFGFNIENITQLKIFISEMQNEAALNDIPPLFISTDQEGGKVRRITDGVTLFPGNMAIGAANDEKLAYAVGRITGMELRSVGVNMNLTPDVDINSNPDNPVINTRSFGSNKNIVSAMGSAYIKGIQKSNCIAVAKHFPGHGDTSKDSHKTLPQVNHSIDYLRENEFLPFQSAIESGVAGVMSAHISFPEITGSDIPATLSPYFLTEILQTELKFDGIIMTDDLEMGAIGKNIDAGDAALRAVNAGVDVLLFTTFSSSLEKIYAALIDAYKNGQLSEERINVSARKIIRAKLNFNIANYDAEKLKIQFRNYELSEKNKKELYTAAQINRQITRKGIFYNSKGKLFAAEKDEKVYFSGNDNDVTHLNVENIEYVKKSELIAKLKSSTDKQRVFYFADRYQDSVLNMLIGLQKTKPNVEIRLISTQNPYDLTGRMDLPPVMFTFGNTPEVYNALADYMSGKIIPGENADLDLGFVRTK